MSRLVVKTHRPLQILLAVVILSISLSLMVWGLLEMGHWDNIYAQLVSNKESKNLWNVNRNLEEENAELRERVIVLERSTQIDTGTTVELQVAIRTLQDEVYKLKEELKFYQGIMEATRDSKGLNVQGLHIEAVSQNQYRFKLILTQVTKNDIVAEGTMEVSLEGMQNGVSQVLSFLDVTQEQPTDLTFKFKHFKRFEGKLTLPDGFEPKRVVVQLQLKGKKQFEIKKVFDWPVTAG